MDTLRKTSHYVGIYIALGVAAVLGLLAGIWDWYADLVDQGALLWPMLRLVGVLDTINNWYNEKSMVFAMSFAYGAALFTWLAPPMLLAGLLNRAKPWLDLLLLAILLFPIFVLFLAENADVQLLVVYYLCYCWLLVFPYFLGYGTQKLSKLLRWGAKGG